MIINLVLFKASIERRQVFRCVLCLLSFLSSYHWYYSSPITLLYKTSEPITIILTKAVFCKQRFFQWSVCVQQGFFFLSMLLSLWSIFQIPLRFLRWFLCFSLFRINYNRVPATPGITTGILLLRWRTCVYRSVTAPI